MIPLFGYSLLNIKYLEIQITMYLHAPEKMFSNLRCAVNNVKFGETCDK